ncbi:C-C motif chemokine 1 [Marmota monax]|uniref:C-C motif chemokine 1 n=2 Tax=Marmota TaxID=9992 RepID=UPI001EB0935F|nr:C-C motif chemokine 1 [Marmota monax]
MRPERVTLASPNTPRLLQRGGSQTSEMKLTSVALVCLLLAATWPQDVDSKSMHVSSSRCCFSFAQKRISQKTIQCYRETSSTCAYQAAIFKLKGGRESCALKTERWVQGYLGKLKPCLLV